MILLKDRFRGCLTRMQYGKCNKDDLIWLECQVAGKYNSQLDLSQPQWRYTSVISGHNSQRDKLNEMAAIRFSCELGKPLHRFYSHDTWGSDNDPADPAENRGMKRALDTARDNLAGVEYIFIDELSMISCYDFYKISERLSLIMNETELA